MGQPRIKRDGAGTLWLVLDAPRLSIALTSEHAAQLMADLSQAGVGLSLGLDGEERRLPAPPMPRSHDDEIRGWTRVNKELPTMTRMVEVLTLDGLSSIDTARNYVWPGLVKSHWRYVD